jgi:hypothetical protein
MKPKGFQHREDMRQWSPDRMSATDFPMKRLPRDRTRSSHKIALAADETFSPRQVLEIVESSCVQGEPVALWLKRNGRQDSIEEYRCTV